MKRGNSLFYKTAKYQRRTNSIKIFTIKRGNVTYIPVCKKYFNKIANIRKEEVFEIPYKFTYRNRIYNNNIKLVEV